MVDAEKIFQRPVVQFFTWVRILQITMGVGVFYWGWRLYGTDTFDASPAYAVMAAAGDEVFWGAVAMTIGVLRVCFVLLNGAIHGSIFFRLGFGAIGAPFWMVLAYLFAAATPGGGTAPAAYALLAVLEIVIMGYAVDDWHERKRSA